MKEITLYQTLFALLGEVQGLRNRMRVCPLAEVLDIHDVLVATFMSIRDIAGSLTEFDPERSDCLRLLELKVTEDIMRLTDVESQAGEISEKADAEVNVG